MGGMLYRTKMLAKVQRLWKRTVFDANRPHCMDVDVALASISDQVAYYAVPAVQDPGFFRIPREKTHRSPHSIASKYTSITTTIPFTTITITVTTGKPIE